MEHTLFPERIPNWIADDELPASGGQWLDKLNPHDGTVLCQVARSEAKDIRKAVESAKAAQSSWAALPPVKRGDILREVVENLRRHREEMAQVVALETGKSFKDALGETEGAAACGFFYAGEGTRLYGKTTTSGTAQRYVSIVRQPVGVAGLIIAANTPIANVAWKVFPALVCGNAVVLKAAEDTPITAWLFAKIAQEAGLPTGVLNVVQGYGAETGPALVNDADVGVISFTGSTAVGRSIAISAGERLAKVSLELGGKNPLVVCDDADLENAAKWVLLSAFSNAGQRCAASSRIIVFEQVYERFRALLIEKIAQLKVGHSDGDDFGPVINERQLLRMLGAVEKAKESGARVLCGGHRLTDDAHRGGFYIAPTLVECDETSDDFSTVELFGPIAGLYRANDFTHALQLANDSPYGLTACIHTRNLHRGIEFSQRVRSGMAVVNAGTFGSEPHMPFGGVGQSGNGSREPGTEALDIYSELKSIYLNTDLGQL